MAEGLDPVRANIPVDFRSALVSGGGPCTTRLRIPRPECRHYYRARRVRKSLVYQRFPSAAGAIIVSAFRTGNSETGCARTPARNQSTPEIHRNVRPHWIKALGHARIHRFLNT